MPAVTRDLSVVALAGIAGPDRFRRALEHDGWRVARLVPFADHHVFTREDLDRVSAAARETGAQAVLTTEKDAMRLLPLRPLPFVVAAVPLTVTIEPAEGFRTWLVDRLREVRA
jgi:tetraacyldisaccharide 4'-kinase